MATLHGQMISPYDLMAQDVFELCQELNLKDFILVGHSMGGKVAINFAQKHEVLLAKLVIVDIGIKAYPMHHEHILAGIHSVDLPNISARRQADENISVHIESEGIKQFLLKNLYWKDKGTLAWRMNVIVLEREMNKILSAMEEVEVSVPTLFIRGAMSNYILDDDIESIEDLETLKLTRLIMLDTGFMLKLQMSFLKVFCRSA